MTTYFPCPSCHAALEATAGAAGGTTACTNCRGPVVVPPPPTRPERTAGGGTPRLDPEAGASRAGGGGTGAWPHWAVPLAAACLALLAGVVGAVVLFAAGAFGPGRGNPAAAKGDMVLLEFRPRAVTLAKGDTTPLRLTVQRLAGADDVDLTVRLNAGSGLEVPARLTIGRGQEEAEVEVRAGDRAGVFVVRARAEGGGEFAPTAECRVSVGGPSGDRRLPAGGPAPSPRPAPSPAAKPPAEAAAPLPAATPPAGHPVVLVKTSMGDFKVELYPDKAPRTVATFLVNIEAGYYDRTLVHDVWKAGRMAFGYRWPGMVGKKPPNTTTPPEKTRVKNEPGTLSTLDGGTYMLLNFGDNSPWSDKNDCVIGRVVEGMEVVAKIREVPVRRSGEYSSLPVEEITVTSIRRVP